jgi:hypothetical protein
MCLGWVHGAFRWALCLYKRSWADSDCLSGELHGCLWLQISCWVRMPSPAISVGDAATVTMTHKLIEESGYAAKTGSPLRLPCHATFTEACLLASDQVIHAQQGLRSARQRRRSAD